MMNYALTLLIFIPLIAAIAALPVPSAQTQFFKRLNLGVTVLQLVLLVTLLPAIPSLSENTLILQEKVTWFSLPLGTWGTLQAEYFVGLDGLSFAMVILTVMIMVITAIASWNIHTNHKGYFILLMILNGAIVGTFCALDFLLFYLFFEFMLLPMYFLIGIWGGPRREYASIKFLLYTLFGSLLILIVLVVLYISFHTPGDAVVHTFNLLTMQDGGNLVPGSVLAENGLLAGLTVRQWAFLLLLIGFAIKLPAVPLHTWLPDAHVEAPTPVSIVLAALLLKVGAYGLLRIVYPIFPAEAVHFSWLVALLGVVSIVYGAFNALGSKDLKRLIAYSSVSHMGFVLLGIASATYEGVAGAVYQMFSHGILSALLFIIAGVLYDRTHDRHIDNYSGLAQRMPVYFSVVLLAFFASLGLPGFSGFIGEIMVLLGAFQSGGVNGLLHESFAIVATFGLLIGAGYFLWTLQRMFFGPFHVKSQYASDNLHDLDRRELSMTIPLVLMSLLFGIFPQLLLDLINPFAQQWIDILWQGSGLLK
jgi:NADH-quinone oxidoreductase subunit M